GMADGVGSLEGLLANGGSRMSSRGLAPSPPSLPANRTRPDPAEEAEDPEEEQGETPEEEEEEEEIEQGLPDNPAEEQQEERRPRGALAAASFDEQELEDEETQVNEDYNCQCPAGQEECTCDNESSEREGTVQEPDQSSVPRRGETHMA